MINKLLVYLLVFTVGYNQAKTQVSPSQLFETSIKKSLGKIIVDGELNEKDWIDQTPLSNFKQQFPFDTSSANMQTEVKLTYDEQFLFIGAKCYQPKKYIIQSLRRDFPNGASDIFFMSIDPFKDKLNGFYFAVSPYGVQKEGLIFNGNELSIDWDNKWYCEVSQHSDYYMVEIAIPFKTLRYKAGATEWNINFARNNLLMNERSSWNPVGRNFRLFDLNFCGSMKWDKAPPIAKGNMSIIPFTTAASNKDYVLNTPPKNEFQGGFDAKIAISPSLNLDLTVNPDFAQVEVDRQVTNLSRFELFFPERRQFFLENNDLFGSFGYSNINPFFSRRIGLGKNANNGENVKVPILAGARLSGRINEDWRIGLLNMQTAKSDQFVLPATNFTVAAVQRRIGQRNNLGMIFVNKEELNNKVSLTRFNRIFGMDYNLASSDGKWQGKAFFHQMFRLVNTSGQNSFGGFIFRNTPGLIVDLSTEYVGKNYIAESGFVPRRGYFRTEGNVNFVYFPKGKLNKFINNWRIGPDYDMVYGIADKKPTDWDAGIFFRIIFQNSAEISGALARLDYTYLFSPFDPTNTGGLQLPAGTNYTYFSNRVGFNSNQRKNFFVNFNTRFGKYFNGKILQVQSTLNYRWQPWGVFSVDVNYTNINLPAPYSKADLWLIGPRAETSFSKSVFFNLFMQYNSQINNLNLNARFQWRFKPASDFFLVYTDNYFATDDMNMIVNNRAVNAFQSKNRAVVAKLTYWFNL